MNMYGYTFKQRFFYRLKRFFLKIFIILAIIIAFSLYFFKSDFGNSIALIHDFKNHVNQKVTSFYETQSIDFSNSVRHDLGLSPITVKPIDKNIESPNSHNKINITHDTPYKDTEHPKKEEEPKVSNESEKETVMGTPIVSDVANNSGFTVYKIPFYYDHSNAPTGVSKNEALTILNKASQQWTDACGISFEYKGDKLADYVHNKNVIGGHTGIIKWETQMEGSAIGEAHVGNYQGPANGFVLALFTDFFARNKADLINTITHEMGHVIGLEHSANKHSIMFATEHSSSILQESDKAMCRYFRYRWSGMSQIKSQDKAGVLSNNNDDDD